jgi:hypothetical protein
MSLLRAAFRPLMTAVDRINQIMGRGTIKLLVCSFPKGGRRGPKKRPSTGKAAITVAFPVG